MIVTPGNAELEFMMELARQYFCAGALLVIATVLVISVLLSIKRGEL